MKHQLDIWPYIKNYKFNSLFIKNFVLILLLAVLPLLCTSFLIYRYNESVMRDEIGRANMFALSKVRDMVDMIALETDKLSLKIASDSDVEALLLHSSSNNSKYEDMQRVWKISQSLSVSTITSEFISSIYLYSDNLEYIMTSTHGNWEFSNFFDTSWYEEYTEKKSKGKNWFDIREVLPMGPKEYGTDKRRYLTNYRLAPLYGDRKGGVVAINIDLAKLGQAVHRFSEGEIGNIFIADPTGKIIYNPDMTMVGRNIYGDVLPDTISASGGTPQIRQINGSSSIISAVDSGYNNWRFVSMIPMEQHEKKINYVKNFMLLVMILSIFASMLIAFLISIKVFEPIQSIISIVKNPDSMMNSGITGSTDSNELKFIADGMITFITQNRQMEKEMTQRILLLKKAQEMALQSQINPHFLYNTLESINWMSMKMTKGENEVSDMISMLSQMLRMTLGNEDKLIPIYKEIDHANLYIQIQKLRYEDNFDVVWAVDENILRCRIVKITLQPLIENCLYHGIKPLREKGRIAISGYPEGDHIVIEVADNGVGMSEETAAQINREMETGYSEQEQHIGIRNVNQRIKLIFGEAYGIRIQRESKNTGVKVKIVIPKVE